MSWFLLIEAVHCNIHTLGIVVSEIHQLFPLFASSWNRWFCFSWRLKNIFSALMDILIWMHILLAIHLLLANSPCVGISILRVLIENIQIIEDQIRLRQKVLLIGLDVFKAASILSWPVLDRNRRLLDLLSIICFSCEVDTLIERMIESRQRIFRSAWQEINFLRLMWLLLRWCVCGGLN